ncbi:hypothetical protein A5722_14820 [Mycobacterium vulneris]|nr:hypothetical protein A5722_14820 [Mycolicibacterium vulneris]OCB66202.1 hypothetical protein A5729_12325 [Mycolicibacterium vulneris]
MIQLTITAERAEQLIADGAQTVADPLGIGPAFVFTGPGLSLAGLAYGGALPSSFVDPYDMSEWDIAILRPQPEGQPA